MGTTKSEASAIEGAKAAIKSLRDLLTKADDDTLDDEQLGHIAEQMRDYVGTAHFNNNGSTSFLCYFTDTAVNLLTNIGDESYAATRTSDELSVALAQTVVALHEIDNALTS